MVPGVGVFCVWKPSAVRSALKPLLKKGDWKSIVATAPVWLPLKALALAPGV